MLSRQPRLANLQVITDCLDQSSTDIVLWHSSILGMYFTCPIQQHTCIRQGKMTMHLLIYVLKTYFEVQHN